MCKQPLPAYRGAMSYYPPQGPPAGPVGPGPGGPPGPWPPYGGPPQWPQPQGPYWPQPYWPGPPRRSHKAIWITVGVVAIAAALMVLVLALAGEGGDFKAARAHSGSAEDQIRQTVRN